ncbi:tetratricopeptide repeat protein [Actinoplanes sp. NPDC026670]|uniref:tetratricopeptide repeat protein n=1 Tax=Actinoplanes sp. NPDC026670 TaxID=3154700 RepID=UPI0033D3A79E
MSAWPGRRQPEERPDRAAIIHGDVTGIVSTGDNAVNVQYRVENLPDLGDPERLDPPPGLVHLPLRPGLFVGREPELRRLDQALGESGRVVVQAVHGLGGIGKSALVAHWADGCRDAYTPIWWITADSPAALDAGLVALAVALQPAAAEVLPSATLRERAIRWLAAHRDWLLILDNVTDPEDVTALVARLPAGRIVVTSRRSTGWAGTTALRLDVLPPEKAVAMLTGVLGGRIDPAHAALICAELGHLPLAVEQAGAYMAQTGVDAGHYLRLLAEYPAEVYRDGEEGRAAERTIARVWRVTLDALAGEPLPGRILRVLAWLGPEAASRAWLGELGSEPEVVRATGRLAAYSMVALSGDAVTVHRLVQAVSRTPDPADPHRQAADITAAYAAATEALIEAVPEEGDVVPSAWPVWRTLLPHVDALTGRRPPEDADDDTRGFVALLRGHAGNFVQGQGDVALATRYHERTAADFEALYGAKDPLTLGSFGNVASAYLAAGDLGRAVPLFERVLTGTRRACGRNHPDTLRATTNLAGAYKAAGDLRRAERLYAKVLRRRRRSLGPEDASALLAANNIATNQVEAGDVQRALPLLEQTLADQRRALGDDHPQTLMTMSNLAVALRRAGHPDRAWPVYEQVLAARRRVLGEDHPQTLNSLNNLAFAYHAAGDHERAIPMFEQVLAARRRVLGDDHPHTLSTRQSLGTALQVAGDLQRAVPMLEQLTVDRRRVLGERHPGTLRTAATLVMAYWQAGDTDRAVPLSELVLARQREVLGGEHPDTLASIVNMAGMYASAGDPDRAARMVADVLAVHRRVLGDEHPATRSTAAHLAALRGG